MARYENTPGAAFEQIGAWPQHTAVVRAVDGPTLLVFAHPRCPCTRATIAELARLLARTGQPVMTRVLYFAPRGDSAFAATDEWATAAAIPGVEVQVDWNGDEARRFGAATSGHAMLFDRTGRQLFSGGITAARGLEGDNAGRSALQDLLAGRAADRAATPVFGCGISSCAREGDS